MTSVTRLTAWPKSGTRPLPEAAPAPDPETTDPQQKTQQPTRPARRQSTRRKPKGKQQQPAE